MQHDKLLVHCMPLFIFWSTSFLYNDLKVNEGKMKFIIVYVHLQLYMKKLGPIPKVLGANLESLWNNKVL